MARSVRWIAVAAICLGAACSTQYRNHGYIPDDEHLARIDIGDPREEVATIAGHPSVTGLLDDDAWFFVRSRYRDYAWRAPVEIDREVVVISFAGDSVSNIERFGLREGRVVPLSRRVTDGPTAGVGLLQQIFANLGNFNPVTFLDGDE